MPLQISFNDPKFEPGTKVGVGTWFEAINGETVEVSDEKVAAFLKQNGKSMEESLDARFKVVSGGSPVVNRTPEVPPVVVLENPVVPEGGND